MNSMCIQCGCSSGYMSWYDRRLNEIPESVVIHNITQNPGEATDTAGTYELEPSDADIPYLIGVLCSHDRVFVCWGNKNGAPTEWLIECFNANTGDRIWSHTTSINADILNADDMAVTGSIRGGVGNEELIYRINGTMQFIDAGGVTQYGDVEQTGDVDEWVVSRFSTRDYPKCGATRLVLEGFSYNFTNIRYSPSGSNWLFDYEYTINLRLDFAIADYDKATGRTTNETVVDSVQYGAGQVYTGRAFVSGPPETQPPDPTIDDPTFSLTVGGFSPFHWGSFSSRDGEWAGRTLAPGFFFFTPAGGGLPVPYAPLQSQYGDNHAKLWSGGQVVLEGTLGSSDFSEVSGSLCAVGPAPKPNSIPAPETIVPATYVIRSLSFFPTFFRITVYEQANQVFSETVTQRVSRIISVSSHWALLDVTRLPQPAPDGRTWTVPTNQKGFLVHRDGSEWEMCREVQGNNYAVHPVFVLLDQAFGELSGELVEQSPPVYGAPVDTFGSIPL